MTDQTGKRLKRWRNLFFALVIFLVTLVAGSEYKNTQSSNFFSAVEEASLNLRFLLRGAEDPALDAVPIVIVKIDDSSLAPELSPEDLKLNPDAQYLTKPWPWNRAAHARLAERLLKAGARLVVFDLVFPGPNEGDFELLDAMEANPGRIILGYDYAFNKSPLGEIFVRERLPYDDLLPIQFEEVIGFTNILRDQDGAVRRAKLSTNIFAERLPFVNDLDTYNKLQRAARNSKVKHALGVRAALSAKPELAKRIPPLFTQPYVNYGSYYHFESVSYIDILTEDRFKAGIFDGAIVLVGGYSDFFKDVVSTPVGDIAGVDYHAHVARSLLNDSFYGRATGITHWGVIGLLATLLLLGSLNFYRAPAKGAFLFGLLLAYLIASQAAFVYLRYILPTVPILLIIVLPGGLMLLYDFTISQYERNRLQSYLGRYVSPEVANLIAEDSQQLEKVLRGANRPIVALFADIRNFTSLSEGTSPERLVDQLNEYFELMVSIIHQRRGSLNKYIGDAILAVWGGIHSEGTQRDCENAVLAALEMGEAMKELNARWANQPDRKELAIGVGLSFGEGFVGNMGHSHRMEFAVMGDVVNLASRLEGATKLYDGYILANGALAEQCSDIIRFQEVDRLQVKGKAQSVPVHTPTGRMSDPTPDWLNAWESARGLYLARQFVAAKNAFLELAENVHEQADNANIYVERCQSYIEHPPPEGWDGTYIMKSK